MTRRPMCILCLVLIVFLLVTDRLGFSMIRGNTLPEDLKARIREQSGGMVCGEVESSTDTEYSQSVCLKNSYLICDSEKISIDHVKVYLKKKESLPVGSVILVSGKLEEVNGPRNPGEFDARQYYACRHIYYLMKNGVVQEKSKNYWVYGQFFAEIREKLKEVLGLCAGNMAPVFEAMVLGDKKELDEETKLRYQMAGIIHILAISGLHISLLGMGLYELLKRIGFGIWPAGFLALVIMLQYGMMTGGSVSTMRAVSMFLLATGAKILGRIYDMLTGLALAAILILVESPGYLLDGGFLLSFSAVIGAGVAAPGFCRLFGIKRKIGQALISSAAIQLVSLPVILWFYGEVSVAGVFLNLLVLPTVGIVLTSGVGTALAGLVHVTLGSIAALPGRWLLFLYEGMCKAVGKIPFASWIAGRPQWWQIAGYYGVLLLIVFWEDMEEWLQEKISYRRGICAVLLGAGVVLLALRPGGELEIICLDVGQGDGIVVETPEEFCFLIDGGSSDKKSVGQYQILPYLKYKGISRLDCIFVSHTDDDHISGVCQILEYIGKGLTSLRVDRLVLPAWKEEPEAYADLKELAETAGVKVLRGSAGDRMKFGQTMISFLSPPKGASGENVNEEGLVLMIEKGDFKGLFTGDIGMDTEEKLMDMLGDADFLKVAHHGSRYSTGEEFLDIVMPEVSVISVSSENIYGHPSPDTLKRLGKSGSRVYCTKDSGAVSVKVKDGRMEVKTYLECVSVLGDRKTEQ